MFTINPMMLPFKSLNPAFYAEYERVRTVVDTAAGRSPGDSTTPDAPDAK